MAQIDKLKIVEAIVRAEAETSAEIRVHVEKICKGDVKIQATKIFNRLGMQKTELKNGVLIYIAHKSRKTAIIGDSGINDKVGADFWDAVYAGMKADFAEHKYTDGLVKAVEAAGAKLKEFFPYAEGDKNELSNSIS